MIATLGRNVFRGRLPASVPDRPRPCLAPPQVLAQSRRQPYFARVIFRHARALAARLD